jgi:AcrR family transcriptional regulator
MTDLSTSPTPGPGWADRAAARSPIVQRSRDRSIQQATQIVEAAIELVYEKGSAFTIQELAKQAHVALQTFYRHFAGKDELLLAVIEHTMTHSMEQYEALAQEQGLDDPLDRLRFYITNALTSLDAPDMAVGRRFITSEHYRLHQLFPDELRDANRAFTDLLIKDISAATQAGQLHPSDTDADAWYITELVMATYHHYSYATNPTPSSELAQTLWNFCLAALGGIAGADLPTIAPRPSTSARAESTGRKRATKPKSAPRGS